jgi:hypothetical protein
LGQRVENRTVMVPHKVLGHRGRYQTKPATACGTWSSSRLAICSAVIESMFDVGCRFRCRSTAVSSIPLDIQPVPSEWHPHIPDRLDQKEFGDWRAGRNAVCQLAALTIGAPIGVADA